MLHSVKQMYGNKLGASDGEIGHVKDVYFDDQKWAIRYLVADTGAWLSQRQVLIPPHALVALYEPGKLLLVDLSRKQIEDSPSIETHLPVSRQYEEEYYRYYGWPYYWQGDGLWGVSSSQLWGLKPDNLTDDLPTLSRLQRDGPEAHLRSAQSVSGYHVNASDGEIGHVCDFMVDDQSWTIRQLVIKTERQFSGKEVAIPTRDIGRISYAESTLFVSLTRESIEQRSTRGLHLVGAVP